MLDNLSSRMSIFKPIDAINSAISYAAIKGKMIGIDNRFKFFVIIKQGKSRLLKFVSVMNCLETNRAKIFTYLL